MRRWQIEDQLRQGSVRDRLTRVAWPPNGFVMTARSDRNPKFARPRASRSCGAFSNRAINGCLKRTQHDCRRRDVGFSAAVLVCSQAIALTRRAADHDLIFTMTNVLAVFRVRCGRQQPKKKPPGRSPDGSFRNCRHGAGSIALLISAGPPPPRRRQRSPIAG